MGKQGVTLRIDKNLASRIRMLAEKQEITITEASRQIEKKLKIKKGEEIRF